MDARELSLEDIIAAEVRKAAATVTGTPVPSQAGGIGGIDIKGITTLLSEVNKLMANAKGIQGGANNTPGIIQPETHVSHPAAIPARNPQPSGGEPEKPKKPDPEKVYAAIYDTLGKLMGIMGDVKLSEVRTFMSENKETVVSVIGANMGGLDI
ncbi:hypothetical protein KO465_04385 [Candidatus Micrarchaeota archaeon]|jgi:hypothetical protein|nr:hypothetical protein [Candidatus Micrarchaeota archaeon]